MDHISRSIVVAIPVTVAYNQWTQFESFPMFMEGVKKVQQLDDTHLRWRALVGGRELVWESEITYQVPDSRIAWRSTTGAENAGEVKFASLSDGQTEVTVWMAYEPDGLAETIGGDIGILGARIKGDLERFKEFVEGRDFPTGAWRGEVKNETDQLER